MHTPLRYDEEPVRDAGANLQRGIEAVGGRLYLTTQRLIFESHRFNVQAGATVIRLADVEGVWKCWTRLFGLIPVVPNSLAVATERGRVYRFVISDRDRWMNLIRRPNRTTTSAPPRASDAPPGRLSALCARVTKPPRGDELALWRSGGKTVQER